MRVLPLACLVLPLSLGVACGSAKAGGSCSQEGFLCQDTQTALECRIGVWLALPCRGPGGCTVASGAVTCDMSGDMAGDACASTAEGKAICTTSGNATLQCTNGSLVQSNTCTTCTVSNGQVVCQQ